MSWHTHSPRAAPILSLLCVLLLLTSRDASLPLRTGDMSYTRSVTELYFEHDPWDSLDSPLPIATQDKGT